jgi:ubiquinone/menaquinone biosynthesis C-methylase UbiE
MAIDEAKLNQLMGRFVNDLGATGHAANMVIGDRLGLYKALAANGPMTPDELAERTGTATRYVAEWLAGQAAGGCITYDPTSGRFLLTEEQAMALADEHSPAFLCGGAEFALGVLQATPAITEAFRTGRGLGWHEHHPDVYRGTERFFRSVYRANLTSAWIPALDDVQARLEAGAKVADFGCGHGASTILVAQAYPNSTFTGFDYHPASIERARKAAADTGVSDRVWFQVAPATSYPGAGRDLVMVFDALHDLGDPVGAISHIRHTLTPSGTLMLVEPMVADHLEDNLHPVGRLFYSFSTLACVPNALSQEPGVALGAQVGEARLRQVLGQAGFSRIRRAAQTPFNLVLEVRP